MAKFDERFEELDEFTQFKLILAVEFIKIAETKEEALYFKNKVTQILSENDIGFVDDVDENNICGIRKRLREA